MNRFEPSDNAVGKVLAWIIAAVIVAAAFFVILFLRGWALTYLWEWFVMPFIEVPSIGIAQALGFCMIGGMVASGLGRSPPKETKDNSWMPFIGPFLVVGLGWIIKGFL